MTDFDRKKHWEAIYQTKELKEVSWYQAIPQTSLKFLEEYGVPKDAKIIDVGGGDSFLVDHLLDKGFENITVLDISEAAILKAKERLGKDAEKVEWIIADAAQFQATKRYDFWHDRAAFHFMTEEHDISSYIKTAHQSLSPNGILVVGTFSEKGPKKCSGIAIRQYSENTLIDRFKGYFEIIKCITVDHTTPSDSIQNFVFCSFRKLTKD